MAAASSGRKRTAVRACAGALAGVVAQRQAGHDLVRRGRPASASIRAASAASAGLPSTWPSTTTSVSTPSTVSPAPASTERALPRLCRSASSCGATRQRQLVVGRLDDAELEAELREDRAALRRARRQDQRHSPAGRSSPSREVERQLARRALGRVRAVHDVLAEHERVVAADRAGRRVERVRRAHHRAHGGDRARPLERERDQRARGDEVDELAEERPRGVLGVVLLGDRALRARAA